MKKKTDKTSREWGALLWLMLLLVALLSWSCSTKKVVQKTEVPVVVKETTHDTLTMTVWKYATDTVRIHDSIRIECDGSVLRWHDETRTTNRERKDSTVSTARQMKQEPVVIMNERVKTVTPPWWKIGGVGSLVFLFGLLVGVFAYKIKR